MTGFRPRKSPKRIKVPNTFNVIRVFYYSVGFASEAFFQWCVDGPIAGAVGGTVVCRRAHRVQETVLRRFGEVTMARRRGGAVGRRRKGRRRPNPPLRACWGPLRWTAAGLADGRGMWVCALVSAVCCGRFDAERHSSGSGAGLGSLVPPL